MNAKQYTISVQYTTSEGEKKDADVNYTVRGKKMYGSTLARTPEAKAAIDRFMSSLHNVSLKKTGYLEHWPFVVMYQFQADY